MLRLAEKWAKRFRNVTRNFAYLLLVIRTSQENVLLVIKISTCKWIRMRVFLSGVPDLWDRNKILSGGDLSHYQVPHCIKVFFYFVDLCLFITIFNFILNYVLIVTFWIFTYHKIWILLIIYCFIWNYWIIYFLACLEVFWSVVS